MANTLQSSQSHEVIQNSSGQPNPDFVKYLRYVHDNSRPIDSTMLFGKHSGYYGLVDNFKYKQEDSFIYNDVSDNSAYRNRYNAMKSDTTWCP
jgi:hypothetical protein